MDNCARRDQSPLALQSILDRVVRLLDIDALEVMHGLCEFTVSVNRDWGLARLDKTVLYAGLVIVLTKTWSAVHNTSTGIRCDEVSTDDCEALLLLQVLEVFEEGHVALAYEVLSWDLLEHLVLLDVCLLEDVL